LVRPCAHGCFSLHHVIQERRTANCRVVIAQTGSIRVIKRERDITKGGCFSAMTLKKSAELPKSVVAESVSVSNERKGADSVVQAAITVRRERLSANCRVAACKAVSGVVIILERLGPHGGV